MKSRSNLIAGVLLLCLTAITFPTFGANPALKSLPGHVPRFPTGLKPLGQWPGTNEMRLAIGVSLRDERGLDDFLAQLYDPASTNYQHYLTPAELADRFGPTAADYEAVIAFARTNHLTVTGVHGNRLLVDVKGSAAEIELAFHIELLKYHHPSEDRDFYAPSVEPSVDTRLSIADVSGLDNYRLPHPRYKVLSASDRNAANGTGSGSSGAFLGNDFRAAYLPGTTLTGVGQTVGLLQFDGYYATDIAAYAADAGMAAVPLQTVLLDGFDGTPTTGPNSGNVEVSLDIEMAMAMAPGLSKIMVFEGGPNGIVNDILNAMAASNQVKQLSCSWGWSGGPSTTTDAIFKEMAAQGQSFFVASGDSDAFTTGATSANGVDNTSLQNAPSSDPYITVVGGTTLTTTGPGGAWASETVWNWGLHDGSYVGSSGGISSYYSIPTWQSGVSMADNGGSGSYRNTPDVAMVADNVFVTYGNGTTTTVGGTSCAAPLWAGLTALINQQAAGSGRTNVGFMNPAIYSLGKSTAFANTFHDIATGNNFSSDSPGLFAATNGYDLCTGWGTPYGQGLINALSGVTNWLGALPGAGFNAAGAVGGDFTPGLATLLLTNAGKSSLTWSLINTSSWLVVSSTNGTLTGGDVFPLSAGLNAAAKNLPPGVYTASLLATNYGAGVRVPFTLSVGQSLVQNGGFESGDFTGWSFSGDSVYGTLVYNAVENSSSGFLVVHSGNYGAFLGDTKLASLSQSFATTPGQYYLLSLWLDNPASGSGQQFVLNWDGAAVVNLLNPAAFSWTNLQFIVTASSTNAALDIEAENTPNYFGLDDIRVVPIPNPVFKMVAKSGNGVQLNWITTTGLVYGVQYRTNLLEPGWVNLRSPFTATNYSAAALDTNALTVSPGRCYRLSVSP